MTPQRERQLHAVAWHNKADYIHKGMRIARRLMRAEYKQVSSPFEKFCRRMARNNERAYERNAS